MDTTYTTLILEYERMKEKKNEVTPTAEEFIRGYEHAMKIIMPALHNNNDVKERLWVVKGILTSSSYFERFSATKENPLGCILSSVEQNAYHFEEYKQALAVATLFEGVVLPLSSIFE
ncbi:hypothetical protein [Enterococcus sp. HY326]|uniref:hypothetical protein n=1 Tax=Enterococcus sp. HY326 TaxID=2971265 RepID=UPI00223F4E79|nr:hypothetical protein [Enterococcus sp. HY326]